MARPKVCFVRYLPYTTTLNRARQFRMLGWEPHIVYTNPPVNSDMFIQMGRVFEGVWQSEHVEKNFDSFSEFVRAKGFDMIYTVGPPDFFNCRFVGVQCPWMHDFRDLVFLVDPQADDPKVKLQQQDLARENANESFTCEQAADLVVYVTPWQRKKSNEFIQARGAKPTPSIWMPNIPFIVPKLSPRAKDDIIRFGYTGSIAAAWENASTMFGLIGAEIGKLGLPYEFHYWSYMQAAGGQKADWYFQHDTLEQHAMIADMAEHVEYGIVCPPTKSDGMNGKTGWPGKLGDYAAAGLNVFVPGDFMVAETVRSKGWGWGYDTPKDIARIMASRRDPSAPRAPMPYLKDRVFVDLLSDGIRHAQAAFESRKNQPVKVRVLAPMKRLLVASDGNRYHAEKHIAKVLGSDFSGVLTSKTEPGTYRDLYLVGLWARDDNELERYIKFIQAFDRVIVHWAGSDVLALHGCCTTPMLKELAGLKNVSHIGQHLGIVNEVRKLYGIEATVLNTPTTYVYEQPFKLPSRFAVSCYYPPFEQSRGLYGLDVIDQVAERMKDVLFYMHSPHPVGQAAPKLPNVKALDPIQPDQYPEFLKHVSAFLRLTSHDGVPYSMVEHLCAGRYCLMQQKFPFTVSVNRDVDQIVTEIESLRVHREPNMAGSNYWRVYNDFGRFSTNVENLLDGVVNSDAQEIAQETGERSALEGAVGR